jgi:hypothetical protein
MRVVRFASVVIIALTGLAASNLAAQGDSLSVQRIFESGEFSARGVTQIRWLDDASYTTLEPSSVGRGARDLVKHDAATGATSSAQTRW